MAVNALSFEDVSWVGDGRRVLDRINFVVPEASRVAIVGPNGSGKTMLARVAAGLVRPTSGRVRLFGSSWTDPAAVAELRRRVGVSLAQGALLSDLTGAENVRAVLGALRPSAERRASIQVERFLADAGVEYCADRSLKSLSLGECRRLDLARVIASNPELLIFDDMLTGVDEAGARDLERRINQMVARRRRALLWIGGHRAMAARMADTVLHLENGRLVGTAQQLSA